MLTQPADAALTADMAPHDEAHAAASFCSVALSALEREPDRRRAVNSRLRGIN
jgi:hypothetical protein